MLRLDRTSQKGRRVRPEKGLKMRQLFRATLAVLLLALPAVAMPAAPASASHDNLCNDGIGIETELIHLENVVIAGQPLGDLYLALDVTAFPPAFTAVWLCTDTPVGLLNVGVEVFDRNPAMIEQTIQICLSSGGCGAIVRPTGVAISLPFIVIAPDGTITIDPFTTRVCVYVDGAATCT